MVVVIALLILAGLVTAIYGFGRWILGPIDRAAKGRRAAARVSIGDFLCLFVAIQIPFTLATRLRSEETESFFWFFAVLSWIVAPVIWISCAATLSRAGITSGKHRLAFMGLVLPIVYYGLAPFVFLGIMSASMILTGNGHEIWAYWGLMIAWVATGIALVCCGLYTNWLVRMLNRESAGHSEADPSATDDGRADPVAPARFFS
jgi:hypothetical protein